MSRLCRQHLKIQIDFAFARHYSVSHAHNRQIKIITIIVYYLLTFESVSSLVAASSTFRDFHAPRPSNIQSSNIGVQKYFWVRLRRQRRATVSRYDKSNQKDGKQGKQDALFAMDVVLIVSGIGPLGNSTMYIVTDSMSNHVDAIKRRRRWWNWMFYYYY